MSDCSLQCSNANRLQTKLHRVVGLLSVRKQLPIACFELFRRTLWHCDKDCDIVTHTVTTLWHCDRDCDYIVTLWQLTGRKKRKNASQPATSPGKQSNLWMYHPRSWMLHTNDLIGIETLSMAKWSYDHITAVAVVVAVVAVVRYQGYHCVPVSVQHIKICVCRGLGYHSAPISLPWNT